MYIDRSKSKAEKNHIQNTKVYFFISTSERKQEEKVEKYLNKRKIQVL